MEEVDGSGVGKGGRMVCVVRVARCKTVDALND